MSIDYVKKAKILQTDLPKDINKIDRLKYKHQALGIIEDVNFDYEYEEMMLMLEGGFSEDDIKEARKINKASYQRVKRLYQRIEKYLSEGRCIFATLSFTDDVLSSTSKETRRKYVSRFLKSISNLYIANIDFGKTTGREHYHAVIVIDKIARGSWSYGFDKYKKIRCDNLATIKLAKYISKLTNHAIKESTKRNAYIYSRESKKMSLSL